MNEYPHIIRNNTGYSNVASIICTDMYQENLEEKFDKCHNLLAFTNGVFDLQSREFRKAMPHEYVSKCMPYDYKVSDFTDIKELLQSLFQDDAKEYALWRIGKILKGGEEKTFTVLIGNGNNGKTKVFVELIKCAFGDFFYSQRNFSQK